MNTHEDIIKIGKYKGDTFSDILDKDPSYILWLSENNIMEIEQGLLSDAMEMNTSSNYWSRDYVLEGLEFKEWSINE